MGIDQCRGEKNAAHGFKLQNRNAIYSVIDILLQLKARIFHALDVY